MASPTDVPDPTEPTTIEPPPCRPPLELVEGGSRWVLEAYNQGHRDGETYSTHDSQMEAMRAGKRRMDDEGHPCLLRWESADSVGTMYWNPLFERLQVRPDRLTGVWVVVPESSQIPFYTTGRQELAVRYAREVQRTYDFRHLDLHAENGTKRRTIDHRFLRHEIDRSGVKFKREAIRGSSVEDPLETEEEPGAESGVTPATPASALAAAVPDLTDIEVLFTEGPVHRYRAGWTDDEEALISILDPDRCDDRTLVDTFTQAVDYWETLSKTQYACEVYDRGIGPSPWVASAGCEAMLSDVIEELSFRDRMRIADDITAAYEAAVLYDVPCRGAAPAHVRLAEVAGQWRGRLADWGLSRAVVTAAEGPPVTRYVAPEQLEGGRTERTPVYRLGALTYWLVTGRPPYADATDLEAAIRQGSLAPPGSATNVPERVDEVVLKAMAPDPADRYGRVSSFREALAAVLE